MKKLLISIGITMIATTLQAQEKNACKDSGLLQKAHLSCISCALEKKGLPTPDDRFLASLGIVARENVDFLPKLAKSPFRLSLDSNYVLPAKNKDGSVFTTKEGKEVHFTTENQYHKYVMEMLLASGYCPKEKFKSANKNEKYTKFTERINDEKFVTGSFFSDPRNSVASELGANSWSELNDLFFVSSAKAGKLFPDLSYENQVKEMKLRRDEYMRKNSSVFSSEYNSFGNNSGGFFSQCFDEISKKKGTPEDLQNQAREVCNAVYDSCGIPKTGDNCSVKYPLVQEKPVPTAKEPTAQTADLPKDANDKQPPQPKEETSSWFKRDGPPAPVEDRSTYGSSTSTIFRKVADGCWYDQKGQKLNLPCTENYTAPSTPGVVTPPTTGNTKPAPASK